MSECPEHKWMGRVRGSDGPCPHCEWRPRPVPAWTVAVGDQGLTDAAAVYVYARSRVPSGGYRPRRVNRMTPVRVVGTTAAGVPIVASPAD